MLGREFLGIVILEAMGCYLVCKHGELSYNLLSIAYNQELPKTCTSTCLPVLKLNKNYPVSLLYRTEYWGWILEMKTDNILGLQGMPSPAWLGEGNGKFAQPSSTQLHLYTVISRRIVSLITKPHIKCSSQGRVGCSGAGPLQLSQDKLPRAYPVGPRRKVAPWLGSKALIPRATYSLFLPFFSLLASFSSLTKAM
jgi:hypothetical protein